MKKAVFFDMDGTLFDTEKLYFKSLRQALAEKEIVLTKADYIQNYLGCTAENEKKKLYEVTKDKAMAEQIHHNSSKYYLELVTNEGLEKKQGLDETLSILKSNRVLIYVASSTESELVEKLLKKAGIWSDVAGMVGGDQVKRSKPSPEIFLKTLTMSKLQHEEVVIVEDSPAGMQAGIAAGIETIVIPDLLPREHYENQGNVTFVNQLPEILPFIL